MIVVVGNVAFDVTHRVRALPRPGETVLSRASAPMPGGKGLNQAAAAARCGAPVRLSAPIAQADVPKVEAALRPLAHRIELDLFVCEAPSDSSVIVVDDAGENAIVSTFAAAVSLGPADAAAAVARLGTGDIALLQGNLTMAARAAALSAARASGARTMLNPAPWDDAAEALVAEADIVVVNEGEAAALAGAGCALRDEAALIVTLGARGARVYADGAVASVPTPDVNAIDTAGAGDAFVGALAAALVAGRPLLKAVAEANAFAAGVATREGTLAAILAS